MKEIREEDPRMNELRPCMELLEEITVDIRKGVPQCKFVMEISEGEVWNGETEQLEKIPEEYIFQDDNS